MKTSTLFLIIILSSKLAAGFKLGVENISPELIAWLQKKRVGLVTNQTGKDQEGRPTHELLRALGIPIIALFAPEHGIKGNADAAQEIAHDYDHKNRIPIMSLYGKGTGRKISESMANLVDVFIFDMQDSGMRHYTYISTLFNLMQAAAEFKKTVVVLDRPNPLGPLMEGPLVEPDLQSFISIAPIPVRHGMTIGELALFFKQYQGNKAEVIVVPMDKYHRHAEFPSSLSLALSPNIQTKESCYGYSFLGLLGEVRPLNVGVGTGYAFRCICLPESMKFDNGQWRALKKIFAQHYVTTTHFSYVHPEKKQLYKGLKIEIPSINQVYAHHLFVEVISFFKAAGIALQFSKEFNKAMGTARIQEYCNGSLAYEELMQKTQSDLSHFLKQSKPFFIYDPQPHLSAHSG